MTIREAAGCKAGVTSGIVVQATKAGLLEISRHDTGARVLVPPSDVTPLPLQAAPGDTVMRARLDGAEEAATARRGKGGEGAAAAPRDPSRRATAAAASARARRWRAVTL